MRKLAPKENSPPKAVASRQADRETGRDADHQPSPISQLPSAVGNQAMLRLLRSNTTGGALEPKVRGWFEQRLGETLGEVRIHQGPQADALTREHGALAATVGQDIAINSSVDGPSTAQGRFVLAHELVHAVQQKHASGPLLDGPDPSAENHAHALGPSLLAPGPQPSIHRMARPALMFLTAASGQYASSSTGEITADLTSPVVVGREVLVQFEFGTGLTYGPVTALANPYPHILWSVIDRDNNTKVLSGWSAPNQKLLSVAYPRVGHFRIEIVYVDPRQGQSAPLTLDQDAVAENAALAGVLSSDTDYAEAEKELVDDFLPYVTDAAAATGAQGITARFLAAILREEIANTAARPTFMAWLLGTNKEARGSELSDVKSAIEKKAAGAAVPAADINKSVGVGQLRLSTAAMVQGSIPWIDQDPQNRQPARTQIESNFAGLSTTAMSDLLTLLAWPKSNIAMVAATLAKLKNRANRYPSLTRAAFGGDQRACEIIATEYNLGSTTSTEAAANPSDYGQRIWNYMSLPVLQKYFPNT